MKPDNWTSLTQVKEKLQKSWDTGGVLREALTPSSLFPLRIPLKTPTANELSTRFADVQVWIEGIKKIIKFDGFMLEWREVNHRLLGRNQIPVAIQINSLQDALRWLSKLNEQNLFLQLATTLLNDFPELRSWVIKFPHQLISIAQELSRLMAILHWKIVNPRPEIYVRQLSLPGVDTKFIEQHKKTLMTWFDVYQPEDTIQNDIQGVKNFALRYGFKEKPEMIRFRLLDNALYLSGLSDLMVTVEAFSQLKLQVDTVFVTENDINALVFPDYPKAIVIFGRGYGFDNLKSIRWLKEKQIKYWGDIDTHGFAILNQFRMAFPQTESFLMDEETLLDHRLHWSHETKPSRADLGHLSLNEYNLYQALKNNRYGEGVRLEQEYINYQCLLKKLSSRVS